MMKYTWLIAIAPFFLLIACKERKETSNKNMDELIKELRSGDTAIRYAAIERLENNIILDDAALQLIEAASGKFPPAKYEFLTIEGQMIEAATKYPSEELIEPLKNGFAKFNPNAREKTLIFLAGYDNEKSVRAYTELVSRYKEDLDYLPTAKLGDNSAYRRILFPALLTAIDNKKIAPDVLLLLLNQLEKQQGKTTREFAASLPKILLFEDSLYRVIIKRQAELRSMNDIWDDGDYMEQRRSLGIIIDLLGYLQDSSIAQRLAKYFDQKDNHLKLFAAMSALRHGRAASLEVYMDIAKDPETRNTLYDNLAAMNKKEYFPEAYKTQAAFAESNMVNWLLYPTELGRKPDAIELMKVITVRSEEDGMVEYYLFRFRSSAEAWKDNGWIAAVSGYFVVNNKPGTQAYGDTFSTFEKWESKTPEAHLQEITGLIDKSENELRDR